MAGGGRSTHIHTQHSWAAFQRFLAQPEYIRERNRCNPVHWLWRLNQGHMHCTCCDFAAKSTWVNSEFAQRWMILTVWLIWFLEKFQSFLLFLTGKTNQTGGFTHSQQLPNDSRPTSIQFPQCLTAPRRWVTKPNVWTEKLLLRLIMSVEVTEPINRDWCRPLIRSLAGETPGWESVNLFISVCYHPMWNWCFSATLHNHHWEWFHREKV